MTFLGVTPLPTNSLAFVGTLQVPFNNWHLFRISLSFLEQYFFIESKKFGKILIHYSGTKVFVKSGKSCQSSDKLLRLPECVDG